MARILIVGTQRYSINMCDFDLMFRQSEHEVVKVLYHSSTARKAWFKTGKPCPGNRGGISTRLLNHPHQSWSRHSDLLKKIDGTDFDYLCLGNGNDPPGKIIQSKIKTNFLFSEYGWMPWKGCFFIDEKGAGALSALRYMKISDMKIDKDRSVEIATMKKQFDSGKPVTFDNFVYVPLQVDTPMSDGKPDFKFQFTGFKNNKEFLETIIKIVPKDMKILVKKHPSARAGVPRTDAENVINISKMDLNKFELYRKMKAMIAINSTSVLEGLLFRKHIFTYGDDVFSGKGVTHEHIKDPDKFAKILRSDPQIENGKRFINCLLQRQVHRAKCNDVEYVRSHYWNQALK